MIKTEKYRNFFIWTFQLDFRSGHFENGAEEGVNPKIFRLTF